MVRIRRAIFATTALLLTTCAGVTTESKLLRVVGPTAPVVTASAAPTALEVTWGFGAPVIPVYIDDRGPWNFVLDSGAGMYALDQRAADELNLKLVDVSSDGAGVAAPDYVGGHANVRNAALIREFRAGPLVDRDTGAAVLDLSDFERVSGKRIDGVLPAAAFHGALLVFDAGKETVTVTAGELPPADGENVLTLAQSPLATVALEICGKPCWTIIDTGGNGGLTVPAALCSSAMFRSPPAVASMHQTIAGLSPVRKGRLNGTIACGRHRILEPVVSLSDERYAVFGLDLLRDFRVTFDFAHQRVRFERNDDLGPIHSRSVRGIGLGFYGARDDDDTWTVGYVLDDSPAAQAGIHADDRIETVDGQPVSKLPDGTWAKLMNTSDSVRLRVLDAGGSRLVDVRVATLVE
jgi:hypothetical protein